MQSTDTVIGIAGMTCQHCVASVTEALEALPEVKEVAVDLESQSATVRSSAPLAADQISGAIANAGFTCTAINGVPLSSGGAADGTGADPENLLI